jgi:CRISPR-associated endoribonuclease Cas6
MRIKLTLIPLERETLLPINYQYPLSAAIYKILSSASPEYSSWLHEVGYTSPDGRPMKLFVFSRLHIPGVEQRGSTLIAKDFVPCTLFVSSPILEGFMGNLVVGLFERQEIAIGSRYTVGRFRVGSVETLPPPQFQGGPEGTLSARFRCLSPIVVSTMEEYKGKLSVHYLRPGDGRMGEAIGRNLLGKFEIVDRKKPKDESLEFRLDEEYIERRGGPEKITKLIWIREGDGERETRVKAFIAPFELSGSIELIRIAYECGIGEKNSLGFGMIEEV